MNRRSFLRLPSPLVQNPSSTRYQPDHDSSTLSPLPRKGMGLFKVSDSFAWDYATASHLLRRCMIGPTHAEVLTAVREGLDATLDRLFTPFVPSYERVLEFAGEDPNDAIPAAGEGSPDGLEYRRMKLLRREILGKWWMQAMVDSPVSLQERMTFFWHNHFTTDIGTAQYAERMFVQIELFRGSATGNFRRLVHAITYDPAMLIYLDGAFNARTANENFINENYSRELLELYTMGVVDRDGRPNYSQRDVSEGARALSGIRINQSKKGAGYSGLASSFNSDWWDSGEKEYFGYRGEFRADDVIEIIFKERGLQVARFICGKLYKYFVSGMVDNTVVDTMADDLIAADWEVEPALRRLFASEHFYDEANRGTLVRSSHDLYLGLVRSLGVRRIPDFDDRLKLADSNDEMRWRLMALGHMPLHPPNVKGWPGGKSWVNSSTIASRLEFAKKVAEGNYATADGIPLYEYDAVALARSTSNPDRPSTLVRDIAELMLGRDPTPAEFDHLHTVLLDGGVDYEWSIDDPAQKPALRIRKLIAAIVQLPTFQTY